MYQGSIVALITPFDEEGNVDFVVFRKLIRFHLKQKTQGIVVCGTTGESVTLSEEEQFDLLKVALEEAKGKLPIIMGTGTNDTKVSILRTIKAKKIGADACLVIVPYYNRPSFDGCFEHFSQIARVGLPMIVYHHPGRTGVKLQTEQLLKICNLDGVIGLKESSGDLNLVAEFIEACRTPVFSGDDALTIPMVALGAVGVISVAANAIPAKFSELVENCLAGNFFQARELFHQIFPFCKSLFLDTNPQGIKYAVSLVVGCKYQVRLPLVKSSKEIQDKIKETLSKCTSIEINIPQECLSINV